MKTIWPQRHEDTKFYLVYFVALSEFLNYLVSLMFATKARNNFSLVRIRLYFCPTTLTNKILKYNEQSKKSKRTSCLCAFVAVTH